MVDTTSQTTPPTQTPPASAATSSPFTTPSESQPKADQPLAETTPVSPPQTPPPATSKPTTQSTTPPPAGGKRHFPTTTVILIVILGAVASFLIYLALHRGAQPKPKEVATVPTPTPYAQSVLSFEQATQQEGTPGATLSPTPKPGVKTMQYNVVLTTNANVVNAVQLELGFDQTVVKVDDINSGPFITNPVQLTKDVNNTTGRISYALGIGPNDKGIQGTGVVAVVTLEFIPGTTAISTKLSFLPKTLVAGAGVNPSVLKTSTDITIPILQATPTGDVTPETPVSTTTEVTPTQ